MGPSTGRFDIGGQRLVTPPIRGRAGELKVIGASVTALVGGHGGVLVGATLRSPKPRGPLPRPEEFTEQRLVDSYSRSASAGLRSAEDQALDSLPDNDIKSAMQTLPQQFRDVMYYADVEGLRYQEIAAIMNTPIGTVASQLHRGRRQLRILLCDRVGDAGTKKNGIANRTSLTAWRASRGPAWACASRATTTRRLGTGAPRGAAVRQPVRITLQP